MRDANESEIEFAAYIGIDWAEQKHACALQSSTASGVEESELLHKPEAVEAWATELYRRFGGRPIAIALEQSRLDQTYNTPALAIVRVFALRERRAILPMRFCWSTY